MNKKINKPYSLNQELILGIVEDIYSKIKECEKLKNEINCTNKQVVALLSVIASSYAPIIENKNN